MSYEPTTKVDSGIFFGGYHSTSQSINKYVGSSYYPTYYWIYFDTAIGNATSDNIRILLNDKTRAYIVGDIYNTNQSGQTALNLWTYGLTYNLSHTDRYHNYNKTSTHNRNPAGAGTDHFDGLIEYNAEVSMNGVYRRDTTLNIPANNFLAGVYV